MKKFVRNFCFRGLTWGAWSGPIVLAIVWLCLNKAGVIVTLSVNEAVLGIFSTVIMGFLAAGISIIYQIEQLPKSFAALIQGVVLYIDYLGFYLLNHWLPLKAVGTFTIIFAGVFIAIWLSVYIPTRISVSRMNKKIS